MSAHRLYGVCVLKISVRVCAENLVRIALVTESRNVGDDGRAALFSF